MFVGMTAVLSGMMWSSVVARDRTSRHSQRTGFLCDVEKIE